MKEDTIENYILKDLASKGRGRIFFAQEYYDRWPESSVRFCLGSLAADGQIARLARGVFCYPRLAEYGMQMMLPSSDEIAQAVAEKSRVRIAPCGDQAAYLVGLTGFQFTTSTYLTDGAPRKINLSNGRTIVFQHTSEMRIFAFGSRKMQLLSNGIRAVGKMNIGTQEKEPIKFHLGSISAEDFYKDLPLCPEWVRDLLLGLRAG